VEHSKSTCQAQGSLACPDRRAGSAETVTTEPASGVSNSSPLLLTSLLGLLPAIASSLFHNPQSLSCYAMLCSAIPFLCMGNAAHTHMHTRTPGTLLSPRVSSSSPRHCSLVPRRPTILSHHTCTCLISTPPLARPCGSMQGWLQSPPTPDACF
jgi:hypothetical protein